MFDGLAYCIYGSFDWPPAPDGKGPAKKTKAPGCVVIRYVKPDGPGTGYSGWMAWVPAKELKEKRSTADLPRPPDDLSGD